MTIGVLAVHLLLLHGILVVRLLLHHWLLNLLVVHWLLLAVHWLLLLHHRILHHGLLLHGVLVIHLLLSHGLLVGSRLLITVLGVRIRHICVSRSRSRNNSDGSLVVHSHQLTSSHVALSDTRADCQD